MAFELTTFLNQSSTSFGIILILKNAGMGLIIFVPYGTVN